MADWTYGLAILPLLIAGGSGSAQVPPSGYAARMIDAPPPALNLDPFYRRHIDAGGIPILSSAAVPDEALLLARDIAVAMVADRPDLRRAMIASGLRVAIMGVDEGTLDLPEQRDWKKPAIDDPRLTICERKLYPDRIGRLSDRDYWNNRARGMGGQLTSAATENLLGTPGTRYYGENIFVHEFSHAILAAARTADPAFYGRVEAAYRSAIAKGMWKGEYAAVTLDEYWAEGTQTWFNSNRLAVIDGRRILSHDDLATYDVALFNVLGEVYGTRHRLPGDVFYQHPARTPPGPVPASTAEVC
ncbi:glycoside hydrolase [Sphingomonas sp. Leaf4]|uniref:glycoside hydrolase n=1 Tax=Sphingomonas sp. Leaf4 TaxID=2876553 RepID=UPI001E654CA6|nr:glycoside hydrolase [Sphingomonas sp. Leaf4]